MPKQLLQQLETDETLTSSTTVVIGGQRAASESLTPYQQQTAQPLKPAALITLARCDGPYLPNTLAARIPLQPVWDYSIHARSGLSAQYIRHLTPPPPFHG